MFRNFTIITFRVFTAIAAMMILIPSGLFAQGYFNHNWYFGNAKRDLRFSLTDQTASLVTNQALPFGQGGSAVATDPLTGTLLFYTDGALIYDALHLPMPGGPLMGTSTQNQPVAICKVPNQNKRYYVFTRSGTTLRFSIVDMNLAGNAGTLNQPFTGALDPAFTNQLVPGMPALSEAMIIIPHTNNTDFWLLAHQQGSTNYIILPITAAGFGTVTAVSATNGFIQNAASFSFHAASRRIAVAPKEFNRDVEILTFSEVTPFIAVQTVPNSFVTSATTEAIFDTEFSNSGHYLYVSTHGQTAPAVQADVKQYDLVATNPAITPASVLTNTPARSYGLQMGPDSTIYHLYQQTVGGPFLLGALTNTDTVAAEVNYNTIAFAGDFAGRQFPNFAISDSVIISVAFTSIGTCANVPTTFFPTVSPDADSLSWEFGDGTTSNEWSPVHTYEAGGPMTVELKAYVNGQIDSVTQVLSITDFDTQIDLPSDTTACSCELPFTKSTSPPSPTVSPCNPQFTLTATINGSQPPDSWQWFGPGGPVGSPGSGTSAVLTPDSAGFYYLIAQIGACQAYRGVNIKEYGVPDQRANIWYFGDFAGLDFNPIPDDPARAIRNDVMQAPEGTSTISDRNGQVVFFTDGSTVWGPPTLPGPTFPVIDTNIGGDPGATQSALIVPVPGDETLYYIFTTQEVFGAGYRLSYSLFDRKLGTLGQIVQKNVLLFEKSTERIAASGSGWLIAHEYGNNSFRTYQITTNGIGNPVISGVGSDHSFATAENGQGYMKLSSGNILAVALPTPPTQSIELFDLVDSSGVITNFRTAKLADSPGRVYGIEFSGNKMFATVSNTNASRLYEFFIDSLGIAHEYTPNSPPAPNTNPQSATLHNLTLGAIQIGPDGQLYVAVDGASNLGTIQVSGDTTILSTFNPTGRPLLAGTNSTLGLPNFVQSISEPPSEPGLSISGFCLGDSTVFSGAGSDNIDTLSWFVDGVLKASGANLTTHRELLTAGTHTVRLLITNRCQALPVADIDSTFTINEPPMAPLNPQTLCTPPLVLDGNPRPESGLVYQWSTGDTTRLLSISRIGTYNVNITSTITGCSTNADIVVLPGTQQINLGDDLSVCSGVINRTLNTFLAPTAVHQWFIDGILQGNTGPIQQVSLTTPGTDTYIVSVTNPVTGCIAADTVVFTINATPVVDLTTPATITCGATNGQLFLNVSSPPGSTVSYTITGSTGTVIDDQTGVVVPTGAIGPITGPAPGLGADTYSVVVTDQLSTCPGGDAVTISTSDFDVDDVVQDICDPEAITITTTSALAGTYIITNNNTQQQLPGVKPATLTFETMPLSPGNYTINVLINSCSAGADLTLGTQASITGAALVIDNCGTGSAVASPAGMNYTWSGPVSATTGQTVTLTGAGVVTVTIVDPLGNECPVTLTQNANPVPIDAQFDWDACQNPALLTATSPIGANFSYRWQEAGTAALIGIGQQLVIPPTFPQTTVELVVIDNTTLCTDTSPSQIVTPSMPYTVDIIVPADPPCENSLFILEAAPSLANPTLTYRWFLNNTGTQIGATKQIVASEEGTYIVEVSDGICTQTGTLNLLLIPTDPGDLFDRGFICPDPANPDPSTRTLTLDPGPGYDDYTWFATVDGIEDPLEEFDGDQTIVADYAATFRVELLDIIVNDPDPLKRKVCRVRDQTEVIIECEPVIAGPNAFRPSSSLQKDGELVNQYFRLFTFFIDDEDFQIYIFNRWGEMIYASSEREFRWNGGYKNELSQLVPAGTYTYVIRYKSSYRPQDGVKEKRGSVVLVR
jgi:gliding motility-associated-like protein